MCIDETPPDGPIRAGSNVDAAQAPPGHSLFLITLGETGWPGVFLFAIVWLRWFKMGRASSSIARPRSAHAQEAPFRVFQGMYTHSPSKHWNFQLGPQESPLVLRSHAYVVVVVDGTHCPEPQL